MRLTLLSRTELSDIPSASGIEAAGDDLYVMSDDSPWLFRLNRKFEVTGKFQVADLPLTPGNKIPKAKKLDLEAMCTIRRENSRELLLFGSGSKSPERDVLLKVNTTQEHSIKKYSLVPFYDTLRKKACLTPDELNIEAAAVMEEKLYLFNRGRNMICRINAYDFLSYLEGTGQAPEIELFNVILPSLRGINATFSGACSTPDLTQIVFTASVENTSNWIDDGEILGSFVGVFAAGSLKDSFSLACVAVTDEKKNILPLKMESVTVRHPISSNSFHLLLVTDNDSTGSELIQAELSY